MMKQQKQQTWLSTLLLLACAGAWLSLVHAEEEEEAASMTLNEVVELVEPFGQGCDPKPERGDIEEMVLNKEDASHESKCFRRCMLQQFEVMPEGKTEFNEWKTLDMMNMMFSDKQSDSKLIVNKCNRAGSGQSDECEVAHSISMCMLSEMRDAGYKIPDVKE
ncbi:general odorant-binding protein 19d [Drosophila montana]|uniref:general odorant-binding protein 19d n=1 Tax=Drosophila montana TaxID=40370 RepID=UPI00313D9D33